MEHRRKRFWLFWILEIVDPDRRKEQEHHGHAEKENQLFPDKTKRKMESLNCLAVPKQLESPEKPKQSKHPDRTKIYP